jgi:hypothetical protein
VRWEIEAPTARAACSKSQAQPVRLSTSWSRVQRLGLDGLRFHDLRHTAATLAAAAGVTTKELMERMGHTSPAVALRYQHVMADRQGAVAAALDGLVHDAQQAGWRRQKARGGHDGPTVGERGRMAGG